MYNNMTSKSVIETDKLTGRQFISGTSYQCDDVDRLENKWKPVLDSDIGLPLVNQYARIAMSLMLENQSRYTKHFAIRINNIYGDNHPKWVKYAELDYHYVLPLMRRYIISDVDWKELVLSDSSIKWVKSVNSTDLNSLYAILKTAFLNLEYEINSFLGSSIRINQLAPLFVIDNNGMFYRFN